MQEIETMIALFKAIPFGIFLSLLIALFMGSGGATGGMLAVERLDVDLAQYGIDIKLYWSWYLFLGGTVLTWFLLLMMGD
ncbi:MAG: hypothetical protein B7Y88_07600 [Sphingomonadales bacterium 32-64-17]|nr:MAG: hypothetical protein B7Y88_07600 [Sphingomonadales bacterium 32-64-17]